MPKKRRKRNEIVIPPPHLMSEKEVLLKDTTRAEAGDVFKVSEKTGRGLSLLMIVVGALLSILSVVSILTSIEFIFSNALFVGGLGFLGAVNVFCGLILLGKK